jgi:hypothetical protein
LEDAELAALATAIGARPLTMTCWSLAVGRSRGPTAAADLGTNTKLAWTIANRAIDALRTPLAERHDRR